ncbi:MAG TPA: hypothetical protein VJ022_02815 [Anaerolineales bacterium]|nr:hypothetical protein [Anaerolineales bacterium]
MEDFNESITAVTWGSVQNEEAPGDGVTGEVGMGVNPIGVIDTGAGVTVEFNVEVVEGLKITMTVGVGVIVVTGSVQPVNKTNPMNAGNFLFTWASSL